MAKNFIALASIMLLFCGLLTSAANAANVSPEEATASATTAADAWLKLVDDGDFYASWTAASSLFKNNVPEDHWTQQVGPARKGLGAVLSRKLMSSRYATTLPGAPDGQYVVIKYLTSFDHKKSAIETVTSMLDSDGQWRVAGYYIK